MKASNWLRRSSLGAVALAVALSVYGCSDNAGFDGGLLAPQEASFAKGGKSENAGKPDHAGKKDQKVKGVKRNGQVGEYSLASGKLPNIKELKAEALIDERGGCISAAGHILCVPAGVIEAGEPATFKLQQVKKTLEDGSTIVAVDAKASRMVDTVQVEVGENGFGTYADGSLKKVYLYLTYDWADNRPEVVTSENSAVLYFRSSSNNFAEAEVEVVEGVFTTKRGGSEFLVAPLEHFSEYGIGWPNFY